MPKRIFPCSWPVTDSTFSSGSIIAAHIQRSAPHEKLPYTGNPEKQAEPLRLLSKSIILFSREIRKKVDTMQHLAENVSEHHREYPWVKNPDFLTLGEVSA
ncbi:MAG: hypothetical protein ACYTFW_13335 [Planctomycetota bacterium]|jgi:hypothetical protein